MSVRAAPDPDARPGESESQRWDRNFTDLLQEVRVAQTGVQILFAFLLTIPFSAGFDRVQPRDKACYIVVLLAAAAASAFLIAPVSYHRMVFRQGRKAELVRAASTLAKCGIVCLLIAIVGAVFVVMDIVAGPWAAIAAAGAVGALSVLLWYVLPIRHARKPAGGNG